MRRLKFAQGPIMSTCHLLLLVQEKQQPGKAVVKVCAHVCVCVLACACMLVCA